MAAAPLRGAPAPALLASLRGMLRAQRAQQKEKCFAPSPLLETLNALLKSGPWPQQFTFNLLHLSPISDALHFAFCGLGGLYHLPAGSSAPRKREAPIAPLGREAAPKSSDTNNNWHEEDTLILHTFDLRLKADLEAATPLRQTESTLRRRARSPYFAKQTQLTAPARGADHPLPPLLTPRRPKSLENSSNSSSLAPSAEPR